MTELVHEIPSTYSDAQRESQMKYLSERAVALLVVSNGNEEQIRKCVKSARVNLCPRWGKFEELWMCDDIGSTEMLSRQYPDWRHFTIGGQYNYGITSIGALDYVRQASTAKFIFCLNSNFKFLKNVHVDAMARIMTRRTYIAQMALRCAWPPHGSEVAESRCIMNADDDGQWWYENRIGPSCNPSLNRRSVDARDEYVAYAYFGASLDDSVTLNVENLQC